MKTLKKYWKNFKERLEAYLNRLTYSQKMLLIFSLLLLFVVVDFCYIWSAFRGGSDHPIPKVEHLKIPPILKPKQTDSIHFKSFEYGTFEKE